MIWAINDENLFPPASHQWKWHLFLDYKGYWIWCCWTIDEFSKWRLDYKWLDYKWVLMYLLTESNKTSFSQWVYAVQFWNWSNSNSGLLSVQLQILAFPLCTMPPPRFSDPKIFQKCLQLIASKLYEDLTQFFWSIKNSKKLSSWSNIGSYSNISIHWMIPCFIKIYLNFFKLYLGTKKNLQKLKIH